MKKIGLEKIIFGGLLAALIALRLASPSMTMEAQAATYGTNGEEIHEYYNNDANEINDKISKYKGSSDDIVSVKTKSGITWNFKGSDIRSDSKINDFNIEVGSVTGSATGSKIEKAVGEGVSVCINFRYSGDLPGKATIKVPKSSLSKLGTNKDLCVYYFNNETNKLEEGQRGLTIKDGYLEFTITHCSDYIIKVEEGSTKEDDDDDDDDHHETHTTASWIKNPNEKPALVMTGVSLPAGTSLGWAEQGDLGKLAFKAATPAGWTEAFSFNMLTNGKPEYTLKSGTMTLIIPSSYQKANRTYAVLAIDQSGAVYTYPDTDTKANTVTVNINVTGYAFDLIYTE